MLSIKYFSECSNAMWECYPADEEDKKIYPNSDLVQNKCNASANLEFTTCEPVEPITCKVRKIVCKITVIFKIL